MLIVMEREKQLVQRIFDMYEQMTQDLIAKLLNKEGVRKPCKEPGRRKTSNRSERMFTAKDIRGIISEPLYTGIVEWGKTTKMPGVTPVPIVTTSPNSRLSALSNLTGAKG